MYVYVSHRNAAVCTFTPKLLYALRSKQHTCVKQDMCLWNTDAPGGIKVKIWQKSQSPTF